ncbi:MAG: NUDIX domain-containing protein [Nanoarchaeota archaeon]|nr:NUDIX domain-containing protein [Nanoarchaeota archaeon]
MENKCPSFEVIVLGIVFDSEKKKFLIGRKEEGPDAELLGWSFPGGRIMPGEDLDTALKEKIKLKTGCSVKNIGTFFSQTYEENPGIVSVYFLTKVFEGEERPGDDVVELKWVRADELDSYFKIPLHKKLKEFLSELI